MPKYTASENGKTMKVIGGEAKWTGVTLNKLGTVKGGNKITFALPDEFLISRDGTERIYHIEKHGDQYTSGICFVSPTSWEGVYLGKTGDDYYVYLKLYAMSAASAGTLTVTNYASDLTFYEYKES